MEALMVEPTSKTHGSDEQEGISTDSISEYPPHFLNESFLPTAKVLKVARMQTRKMLVIFTAILK